MRREGWPAALSWPALVLLCLLSAPRASGQERLIEERIGNVDFAIPREFVSLWPARSKGTPKTFVQVEFGYPQPEPLGTWGFHHDGARTSDALKAAQERGLQILSVDLDGQPTPTPDRYRLIDSFCRSMGGQNETHHSFAIEITVCIGQGQALAASGRSEDGDSYFRLDPYTGTWRMSTFDHKDSFRTTLLRISPESLQDWRALMNYAKKVVGGWRK